jgi:hypothetical protein
MNNAQLALTAKDKSGFISLAGFSKDSCCITPTNRLQMGALRGRIRVAPQACMSPKELQAHVAGRNGADYRGGMGIFPQRA